VIPSIPPNLSCIGQQTSAAGPTNIPIFRPHYLTIAVARSLPGGIALLGGFQRHEQAAPPLATGAPEPGMEITRQGGEAVAEMQVGEGAHGYGNAARAGALQPGGERYRGSGRSVGTGAGSSTNPRATTGSPRRRTPPSRTLAVSPPCPRRAL
jgi:hypothetical protein